MINFYRRFIPGCATLAAPLNSLTADKTPLPINLSADESHPIPNAPLSIMVDASTTVAGAALYQQRDTKRQPLAYFSKFFSPTEQRCSTFGREILAAYFAVRHFKHYAEGSHVAVYTDHLPLVSALRNHSNRYTEREIRQVDFLPQFDLEFRHVKCAENEVVDTFSRISISSFLLAQSVDYEALAQAQIDATYPVPSYHRPVPVSLFLTRPLP